MSIPFTQFLMPNGRQTPVEIDRPPEIEALAKRLLDAGCHFEIEMLTTGEVSMEVVWSQQEEPVASALCPNGPEVPVSVDQMIREAVKNLEPDADMGRMEHDDRGDN
jgi:hypothetical protein